MQNKWLQTLGWKKTQIQKGVRKACGKIQIMNWQSDQNPALQFITVKLFIQWKIPIMSKSLLGHDWEEES